MRVLLAAFALCSGCVVPHVTKPRVNTGPQSEAPLPLSTAVVVSDRLRQQRNTMSRSGMFVIDEYQVATGATLIDALAKLLERDFTAVEIVTADEPPAGAEFAVQPYSVSIHNMYDGEQRLFELDTWLLVTRGGASSLFHYTEQVALGNVTLLMQFGEYALPPIMASAPRELFERTLRKFREELLEGLLLPWTPGPKTSADVGDVLRVVMRHPDELRACANEQRSRGTVKHGVLELRLSVQPSAGEASGIEVTSSEASAEPIARCMAARLAEWRYPRFEKPSDPVPVPVRF